MYSVDFVLVVFLSVCCMTALVGRQLLPAIVSGPLEKKLRGGQINFSSERHEPPTLAQRVDAGGMPPCVCVYRVSCG